MKYVQVPIGIQQTGNGIPAKFMLRQNYPNPFNPVTNIEFSLPHSGNVKLAVYDILGREVLILADQKLNPGNYSYRFEAGNLSSGVYFYRISGENFTDIKKMVLVK